MKVTLKFETDRRIFISESTVQRQRHEVGLFNRVAQKKPYVNKTNRLKHLNFAKGAKNNRKRNEMI